MSTINNPDIIRTMLENEGVYPGDPPCVAIYSYVNPMVPAELYAVFWAHHHDDMNESPNVTDYTLLMKDGILTSEGERFLQSAERADDRYIEP